MNKFKRMKKTVSLLLTLVLLLSMTAVAMITVSADDTVSNDRKWSYYYNTFLNGNIISSYDPENELDDSITELVIPANIDGNDIKGIMGSSDNGIVGEYRHPSITSVVVSDDIEILGENFLANNHTINKLFIPASVTTIQEDAFYDCFANGTDVYMFSTTATNYSECAFSDYDDQTITIHGYANSGVYDWWYENHEYWEQNVLFETLTDSDPNPYSSSSGDSVNPLNQLYESEGINALSARTADHNGFSLPDDLVYTKGKLLGVQTKAGESEESVGLRFIAELSSDLISSSSDYGFVVAKCSNATTEAAGKEKIESVTVGTVGFGVYSCKAEGHNSNNIVSGYGNNAGEGDTVYKYVTMSIDEIGSTDRDQGFLVRFYATIGGTTYYANYNGDYYGCCASYNTAGTA